MFPFCSIRFGAWEGFPWGSGRTSARRSRTRIVGSGQWQNYRSPLPPAAGPKSPRFPRGVRALQSALRSIAALPGGAPCANLAGLKTTARALPPARAQAAFGESATARGISPCLVGAWRRLTGVVHPRRDCFRPGQHPPMARSGTPVTGGARRMRFGGLMDDVQGGQWLTYAEAGRRFGVSGV
jgi:hypothetical protein